MSAVKIEQDGPVTLITIDRPDKLNAINTEVAEGLQAAFTEFEASDQRAAVLTGAGGRAFSAGVDVSDVPDLWRCVPTVGFATQKPLICAVDGWCVGGALVIAAMCDLAVCTEGSTFYYPEGRIGFTGGMIATLAGRIAHKHAMEIMMLGRKVPARRAYEMGLVNEITPPGGHLDAALAMAREAAAMAPLVTATLKRFVTEETVPRTPAEQMGRGLRDLGRVRHSQDCAEGIAAFLEKRPPDFQGR
jgi:enoyl-CoA hydratase/carnithine racemase